MILTAERARELLRYVPETGEFFWAQRISQRGPVGAAAGCLDNYGYRVIRICERGYKAHRLAWLIVYGEWPTLSIDHIDRDKSNNAIRNLREALGGTNQQNKDVEYKPTWRPKSKRWRAQIRINGKRHHLGLFLTRDDARAAYYAARIRSHAV